MKMNDPRTKKIVIRKFYDVATTFTVDEWHIPNEIMENYTIMYEGRIVGYFWLCNTMSDGMQLISPMDLPIIEFIIQEMRARKFQKNVDKEA
jgi:hypothetical protein